PPVELACGSQSINRDRTSAAAKEAARLMAVVVFPTPPFWFATAITIPMSFLESNEKPLPVECRRVENESATPQNGAFVLRGTLTNVCRVCSTWNTVLTALV